MCAMQQAFAHRREGDSDAVSNSTDTSCWSTPSRLCCGSNTPHYSSDFEDQTDSLTHKTSEAKTSDKCQESKPSGRTKAKKAQGDHKQKTNNTANHQLLKLPPIKPLQVSSPRSQSADLNCIRELKSQVWDLQHQLSEARTENKLLKRLQHRHMVALQHFQDSESSIAQILTKHSNEARVLQGLLRETRTCRDNLARQLQATGNKLLNAKASLQHLQLLSQDHSLLEREELTLRLAKATAELEEKDKRILALERNLELCKASFNRQITIEHRKISKARKISCYLQEQIYQLTKEIQDRERELETHNIYSHRFLKGSNQKGRESKMVQTDGLVLNSTEAASLLELQYCETEQRLEEQESSVNWCCCNNCPAQESFATEYPETEVSINVTSEKETGRPGTGGLDHLEETETERCADTVEQNGCSGENPELQIERDSTEEEEAVDAPQELEEEHTEEHEGQVSTILEESLNTTEPKCKGYKLPKTKRIYSFKQTIENLHSGRPAYSSVDTTQDRMRVDGRDPQQWDL
ncbi:lebercilin-like protein isoform X1 [Thunnus albacares]|uniref:lebercilin-like protein isoform X1 n=1 Tax=Thunnus albacares TaxID=8236 RepID=UPI001CF69F56|nr:lebercilin-like protein isoform X1 [Thunnus albacares]XP_044209343.1 lebercilin-like protein isoform X1 [Thunnus albacares]